MCLHDPLKVLTMRGGERRLKSCLEIKVVGAGPGPYLVTLLVCVRAALQNRPHAPTDYSGIGARPKRA
jgi:hypothetical protein